jgi:membrane-associated phospholipid phosphatase
VRPVASHKALNPSSVPGQWARNAALAANPGGIVDRLAHWIVPVAGAGVAISTVQLHYHRPSDAIGGWALGLAAGILARQAVRGRTRVR